MAILYIKIEVITLDYNLIISPIVGAAIGGFANLLAIQMLFFPIKERKIFGLRIPFTPGIIPKERMRIAKSVGETISNYFLSEDVIVSAIISKEAEKEFGKYITEFINTQKQSTKTINEILINFVNKEEIINHINNKIIDSLLTYTKSEKFMDFIAEIFYGKFTNLNYDTQIKKIVPKEMIDYIKVQILENSNKLSDIIVDYVTSSSVQFKLRKVLRDDFESSFKLRMLSKVVDVEKIFENILKKLIDYIEQESTQKEMALFLMKSIDTFMENKIENIFEKDFLQNNSKIKDFFKEIISDILNEDEKENIKKIINIKLNELFSIQLNKVLDFLDEYDIKVIQDIIISNIKKMIKNESKRIPKVFDISKIIEDRINSFDTQEMVYIMYDSIKKDVFVMRLFESLIGFVIGLLIALLPYIQKLLLSITY